MRRLYSAAGVVDPTDDRVEASIEQVTLRQARDHPERDQTERRSVTDGELMGATRMRLAFAQPGAALVGYDQDTWAATWRIHRDIVP